MAPVKPGSYLFRRESIAELRQRLGLSQAAMADLIGVPKNTVSRWETGATTPDADSLAAIYSLAQEGGIMANFFAPVKQKAPVRDRVLVYWDASQFFATWDWERVATSIILEARKLVPDYTFELYKAFLGTLDSNASALLETGGWRVWEPEGWTANWSEDIYDQVLSDAGQNPSASVVVLVAGDARYVDTVQELKERGIRVYLMTPRVFVVSSQLIEAVGRRRWIELP